MMIDSFTLSDAIHNDASDKVNESIEHLPTWPESQCKQQSKSLVVPVQGLLEKPSKIQGTQKCM